MGKAQGTEKDILSTKPFGLVASIEVCVSAHPGTTGDFATLRQNLQSSHPSDVS